MWLIEWLEQRHVGWENEEWTHPIVRHRISEIASDNVIEKSPTETAVHWNIDKIDYWIVAIEYQTLPMMMWSKKGPGMRAIRYSIDEIDQLIVAIENETIRNVDVIDRTTRTRAC
jgi:hypothetical protein